MAAVIDFFWQLGPVWNWLLIGALLLGLEIFVPGVHFVWFGFAAVIVAGVVAATGIGWGLQLLLFAATAFVCVYFLKGYASPERIASDEPVLNVRGHQYVGRTVTVEDAILGGRGKVRIGDTTWTASGPDLPAGASVKVTGVDGIVLVVAPV
jgi:membrane protein implicated in regulation of membrane protease activity